MKRAKTSAATAAALIMLGVVGCNNSGMPVLDHKLVATGGESTVPLYPDEHTLVEVSHRSQQGGVTGMVGDVQKNFSAKQIDDQTPVRVISSDDDGTEVQITDGPLKGQAGFVAKQNVD
jgi:hypothetical protein